MRIDDLNRTPITQGAEKTDQAAEKRALEKNTVADGTDQAEVSQLAQALTTGDPAHRRAASPAGAIRHLPSEFRDAREVDHRRSRQE